MTMELPTLAQWLRVEAKRLLENCRTVGPDGWTMFYRPDNGDHYPAFWLRDFCYMVESFPEAISPLDLRNGCLIFLQNQREDGTIPDRIEMDGTPVYCAGPLGHPLGEPPTDNAQFMVKLVAEYTRLTGRKDLARQYTPALEKALLLVPRSEWGLVYIDPNGPPRPSYGFTDTVAKTGDVLFPSLLFYEAASELADLYDDLKQTANARQWWEEAEKTSEALKNLWSTRRGMFLAASRDCRQVDVWGSAYAVFIGVTTKEQTQTIGRWFLENQDSVIKRGQVRPIEEREGWQKMLAAIPPDTYQNGAYWAVPSAWVIHALRQVHPAQAQQMLLDLLTDLYQNGVHECINDNYSKGPHYVVSACLPLMAVREILEEE